MKTDRLFVFDCFGVIVSEVAPIWLERYFSPEQAAEVKFEIVHPADLGQISEMEMFDRLGRVVGCSGEQALADWLEIVTLHEGMPELLRELRKNADVVLLSDAPGRFLHRILEREHLAGLFSELYVSSERGLVKPDPKFFELVLRDRGIAPDHALMIDDREKNVAGARAVGMRGLRFTFDSAEAFRQALVEQFPEWLGMA